MAQRTGAAGHVIRLMISISRFDHLLMECSNLSAVRRCLDSARGTAASGSCQVACSGVGACGMAFGCHADGGFWPALGSGPRLYNRCPTRKAAEALCALAVLEGTLDFILFGIGPYSSTQPIRKPFYSHLSDRSRARGEPINIFLLCWITMPVARAQACIHMTAASYV